MQFFPGCRKMFLASVLWSCPTLISTNDFWSWLCLSPPCLVLLWYARLPESLVSRTVDLAVWMHIENFGVNSISSTVQDAAVVSSCSCILLEPGPECYTTSLHDVHSRQSTVSVLVIGDSAPSKSGNAALGPLFRDRTESYMYCWTLRNPPSAKTWARR